MQRRYEIASSASGTMDILQFSERELAIERLYAPDSSAKLAIFTFVKQHCQGGIKNLFIRIFFNCIE